MSIYVSLSREGNLEAGKFNYVNRGSLETGFGSYKPTTQTNEKGLPCIFKRDATLCKRSSGSGSRESAHWSKKAVV